MSIFAFPLFKFPFILFPAYSFFIIYLKFNNENIVIYDTNAKSVMVHLLNVSNTVFSFFISTYSYLTMLCSFLLYKEKNQTYVYTYPFPLGPTSHPTIFFFFFLICFLSPLVLHHQPLWVFHAGSSTPSFQMLEWFSCECSPLLCLSSPHRWCSPSSILTLTTSKRLSQTCLPLTIKLPIWTSTWRSVMSNTYLKLNMLHAKPLHSTCQDIPSSSIISINATSLLSGSLN